MASLLETWLGKGIGSRLWRLRSRGEPGLRPVRRRAAQRAGHAAERVRCTPKAGAGAEAQAELERLMRDRCPKAASAPPSWPRTRPMPGPISGVRTRRRERRAATLAFLEGSGLSFRLAGDFTQRLERDRSGGIQRFIRAWLAPERWFSLRIGPSEKWKVSSEKYQAPNPKFQTNPKFQSPNDPNQGVCGFFFFVLVIWTLVFGTYLEFDAWDL